MPRNKTKFSFCRTGLQALLLGLEAEPLNVIWLSGCMPRICFFRVDIAPVQNTTARQCLESHTGSFIFNS
jgi:hypothetical protein